MRSTQSKVHMHSSVKCLGSLKYAELIASLYTQWTNCHTQKPKWWMELKINFLQMSWEGSILSIYSRVNCNLCSFLQYGGTNTNIFPSHTHNIAKPTASLTHTHKHTNTSSEREGKRQALSLISSHPGFFVSTWSLPVISQLLCKLFNHAHVWSRLNTPDTTPRKMLSCAERRADTLRKSDSWNEWISKAGNK